MMDEVRAARYRDLFESSHAGTSDCAYCPICASIAVVRRTRPEVLDHLAGAVRELIVAAGILLDEAGEIIGGSPDEAASPAEAKVRRIDVG